MHLKQLIHASYDWLRVPCRMLRSYNFSKKHRLFVFTNGFIIAFMSVISISTKLGVSYVMDRNEQRRRKIVTFWSYCQTLHTLSSETWDFSFIFHPPDFPLLYSVSVSSVAGVLILEPVWSHPPISIKLQIHSGKAFIETSFVVANVGLCIGKGIQGDRQNNISEYIP